MNRLIRHFDCHRTGISIRVHNNGLNPETPTCFDHSNCNLTAIGDQDFFEHLQAPRV